MPFPRVQALSLCAMLVVPAAGAFAQSTKTPTIFSPSTQVGTINLRAAVVVADYAVKPLPLLRVVAQRVDKADSVVAETDLDGRVAMSLRVGTYTLRAKTPQPVAGRMYAWAMRVDVKARRTDAVALTNSNASTADSVGTMVAAAMTPAPAPATPAPAKSASPAATTNKVVTPSSSPKPVPASPPPSEQPSPFSEPTQPVQTTMPAQPKRAQAPTLRRAHTSGLMLGLAFDASSIRSDDLATSTESGPGLAALLGWGFTKNFAFVVDASGARISSLNGDYNLAHVDVGGRWHFVNRSAFVPFVEVGYAGRALMKNDALLNTGPGTTYTGKLAVLGGGASFGGGFEYFPSRSWALGGGFKWTTGQFSRVQVGGVTVDGFAIDATSARFNMGFTWYPTAN